MTTKQETALAVKSRVENRVAMSGALCWNAWGTP